MISEIYHGIKYACFWILLRKEPYEQEEFSDYIMNNISHVGWYIQWIPFSSKSASPTVVKDRRGQSKMKAAVVYEWKQEERIETLKGKKGRKISHAANTGLLWWQKWVRQDTQMSIQTPENFVSLEASLVNLKK